MESYIPMIFAQNIHFDHWNKTQTYHGLTAEFPNHPSGWLEWGVNQPIYLGQTLEFWPKKVGDKKSIG